MDSDLREPLLINNQNEEQTKEIRHMTIQNNHPSILCKAIIFIGIIILIFLSNYLTFITPLPQGECYYDRMFQITSGLNTFFEINATYRNILLISTSFLADILIILTILLWCYQSKDSVYIIAGFIFYFFRFTIMEVFILAFPTNYLFLYPGFKSLFVSYLPTNDFFFSGHVGFPVIVILEFSRYKGSFIPALAIMTLICQFITMLVLQGHYTIDLVVGCFSGYYLYQKTVKVLRFFKS